MKQSIRWSIFVALSAAVIGSASFAAEVKWPEEPVTIVVAANAGGGTDVQARLVAEYFRKHTGQDMVVEKQRAGSGTVAYEQVRNAEPDGYTLLYYHNSLFVSYYSGIYPHEPLKNFVPLGKFTESNGNAICVPKDAPYSTLDELVAAAKAKPDTIVAGIQVGGFPEYLIRLLEKAAGCTFKCVDAGNASNRLTSLLGGYIGVACLDPKQAEKYYESGDIKVLAICSPERVVAFPKWKSTGEYGYPSVNIPNGQFLYGPIGIKPELAAKMNEVFAKIGADPEYRAATQKMGRIPESLNLEDTYKASKAQDDTIAAIVGKK